MAQDTITGRLAEALDADDYVTAAESLEPDAVYDAGDAIIQGAAAILESFRRTSEWGRRNLDALDFSHEIDPANPMTIVFIDRLRKGGETLELRHAMHVALSLKNRVKSLRLEKAPGETDLVRRFFERHSVQR